ncbi:MAG TPA: response regulator [Anaerolineales bacterium]|nr:response regulator [Anaerolineales bacterium]
MSDSPTDTTRLPLSVLVVDDDELNQRMMRLILKREGHLVECVSNGQEAVNAVKIRAFDIILMDLQMPVMDGVEASKQIRQLETDGARIFIVALTASYLPERGRELYEAGIDNYLAKPFEVEHLRHILQYGLENRKNAGLANADASAEEESTPGEGFNHQIGIQRVGGDRETYKELLSDFIEELPEKLEIMKAYIREKDSAGLYRAAHNLKGVSANLGALQLSEHAQRLEKLVGESYTETPESVIEDILHISDGFITKARNFLAG